MWSFSTATMPSSFSSSEKSLIKSVFPSSTYKIITATPTRVYVAHPTPDRWYYTGVEGALTLVRDAQNVFSFNVVDLKNNGKIAWNHEIYDDFYFYEDKPYFHTFAGDECMIGLCYADDAGAAQLYKKVLSRSKYSKSSSSSSGFSLKKLTGWSKSDKTKGAPEADVATNEPQWNGLVDQLGSCLLYTSPSPRDRG